ncbi:MAG: hypothetical protein HC807_04825 [Gammaproteobacteria bacterium]|nr:hypothetical protein [Gammaproteobacteria bacterium]
MFRVEPGDKVRSVQVRLLEKGSGQPRATQNFNMSSAAGPTALQDFA